MWRQELLFEQAKMDLFLRSAAKQYKDAPAWFMNWLDDVCVRLNDSWRSITLDEVCTLQSLYYQNGQWMPEPLACNTIYKLLDRLGRDTTGILGY